MSFFSFGGASDDIPSAHDGVSVARHAGSLASVSSGRVEASVASVGVQTAPVKTPTSPDLSWYTGPDCIALVLEASLVTASSRRHRNAARDEASHRCTKRRFGFGR
ncbi:hypothetical protein BC830DRAFT_783459 [Chytriomyces sp. MP71]|nr:hypothetical protein BC830DRAFT_783459 [Chytriomyces sp. MP71]